MLVAAEMENIHAILALPMLRGDEPIGGFVIWRHQPHSFSQEEVRFMQALANQSVNAVENARLFEAEREQRKLAEVMREVGNRLSPLLNFNELLDNLLEQLERVAPYDGANVMLVEGDSVNIARIRGYEQFDPEFIQTIRTLKLEINSTPNLKILLDTQKPLVVSDTHHDPDWILISPDYPIHSWAGAPIVIQNQVAAIFSLDKATPGFYQPEHAERLATFAGQVGLALQNSRLFEETQRRLREVTLLSKIIELSATTSDVPSALRKVCTEAGRHSLIRARLLSYFSTEIIQRLKSLRKTPYDTAPVFEGLKIPLTELQPLVNSFITSRTPQVFTDLERISAKPPFQEIIAKSPFASAILVPFSLHR